jgi:two-component system chemotaxis response regulator CheB
MAAKIKVLVVDDSAFMRKLISDFINSDDGLEAIGTARNGEDALKKINNLLPDVVTMDVEMPVMNGLDALEEIMKNDPIPVIMLSSTTTEGAMSTVRAIQSGAIDFISKPSGPISLDLEKVKKQIIDKIYAAGSVDMKRMNISETFTSGNIKPNETFKKEFSMLRKTKKLICIGSSTGGPRALQQVLTKIPKDIPSPILIVQHMPAGFTKSLADRLNAISEIQVKEAKDGEIIKDGIAYIAPGNYHLKMRTIGSSLAVQLEQTPPKRGHRPSVDVMFESISRLQHLSKVAIIMTGMGADGSEGLIKLKESGNTVAIAESEHSSIVFGMPKSAIATTLVDEVVHLDEIASAILKQFT